MNNMEASKLMINSTVVVNTKNGILNEKQLMSKRDELIKESLNVMLDDFTDIKQSYPENNLSNVNVSLDVVVLRREDYEKLITK
jgi:small nuclear ribonucleoprotein (snRNP)-like protein